MLPEKVQKFLFGNNYCERQHPQENIETDETHESVRRGASVKVSNGGPASEFLQEIHNADKDNRHSSPLSSYLQRAVKHTTHQVVQHTTHQVVAAVPQAIHILLGETLTSVVATASHAPSSVVYAVTYPQRKTLHCVRSGLSMMTSDKIGRQVSTPAEEAQDTGIISSVVNAVTYPQRRVMGCVRAGLNMMMSDQMGQ